MKLFNFALKAMGSICQLQFYAAGLEEANHIQDIIEAEIRRFEEKYSRYISNSVTTNINRNAGSVEAITVDAETSALLNYANSLHEQSDGLFDITSGVLRKVWDFKSSSLPADEDIDQLLPLIGWHQVEWQNNKIRLPKVGMEIDFGGYVKEYASDVIANLCISNHISHGIVNLGGDINVIGPHPDGSPWRVGIQHPRTLEEPIGYVDMLTGGIATSGDYERYMIIDGTRYSHLLNPMTGKSIRPEFASVSVIADSCLIAGSLSTIAMLRSETDANWLEQLGLPFLSITETLAINGTLNFSKETANLEN